MEITFSFVWVNLLGFQTSENHLGSRFADCSRKPKIVSQKTFKPSVYFISCSLELIFSNFQLYIGRISLQSFKEAEYMIL